MEVTIAQLIELQDILNVVGNEIEDDPAKASKALDEAHQWILKIDLDLEQL